MPETAKTQAELLALFADNNVNAITAEDSRDLILSGPIGTDQWPPASLNLAEYLSIGATPAQSGSIRLTADEFLVSDNGMLDVDRADVPLIGWDPDEEYICIGGEAGDYIIRVFGQFESAYRMVFTTNGGSIRFVGGAYGVPEIRQFDSTGRSLLLISSMSLQDPTYADGLPSSATLQGQLYLTNGRLRVAGFATNELSLFNQPDVGDTLAIAGTTYTFVAGEPAMAGELSTGTDVSDCATKLIAEFNGLGIINPPNLDAVASMGSSFPTVIFTAIVEGEAGNAITSVYTNSGLGTNAFTTATLTGGAAFLNLTGIPTSNAGLASGDVYRDGAGADAALKVV